MWSVLPTVLLDEIEAAELEGNDDRIEGVLCGAVKQLKVTRAKPDSTLYLSLMYLAKIKPNIFATEGVIEVRLAACPPPSLDLPLSVRCEASHDSRNFTLPSSQALCSLLRRDASVNFKAKGNSLVSVLACNLLMAAYEEDENWPEIFVKVSHPCRDSLSRALWKGVYWRPIQGEVNGGPQYATPPPWVLTRASWMPLLWVPGQHQAGSTRDSL